jgi:predicted  nucleic acid-binding Zn-ribbon protein
MFTLFSELIHELTEFGTQQAALVRQLTIEKRETMRLANTFEGAINALNANFSTISESISFLPIIAKEVRNDVVNLNSTVQNTQQSFLNQQKLTSDQIIESTRQGAQLYNSLNTLFESNRTLTNAHSQIVEALENLSHDNADQKNKVIEMVLVMQHILQDQMDGKPDTDVTYLDDKERA